MEGQVIDRSIITLLFIIAAICAPIVIRAIHEDRRCKPFHDDTENQVGRIL